ncbi:MAG: hypothetical protein CMO55_29090 [Verrucomicrobiales bacterium]|nr:hypothetical protein [Verrucomicrobiales bacterium]
MSFVRKSCHEKKAGFCLSVFCVFLVSLSAADDPKTLKFTDDQIGWTVSYPAYMSRLSDEEIAEIENTGEELMEDAAGGEIEKNHRNLLYLKKGETSSFTSASEPFDEEIDGPYSETQEALYDLIVQAYEGTGLPVEHERGEAMIDGLTFQTLTVRLFAPEKKQVLVTQIAYDRLMGGKESVMISINWHDEEDRELLEKIVQSSKFSIRD